MCCCREWSAFRPHHRNAPGCGAAAWPGRGSLRCSALCWWSCLKMGFAAQNRDSPSLQCYFPSCRGQAVFCHPVCRLGVLPIAWGRALCLLHHRHTLDKCLGAAGTPASQGPPIPLVLGDAEAAFGHSPTPGGGCVSRQGCCWPGGRLPAGGSCQCHREPGALTLPFCTAPAACPRGAIQAPSIPLLGGL